MEVEQNTASRVLSSFTVICFTFDRIAAGPTSHGIHMNALKQEHLFPLCRLFCHFLIFLLWLWAPTAFVFFELGISYSRKLFHICVHCEIRTDSHRALLPQLSFDRQPGASLSYQRIFLSHNTRPGLSGLGAGSWILVLTSGFSIGLQPNTR